MEIFPEALTTLSWDLGSWSLQAWVVTLVVGIILFRFKHRLHQNVLLYVFYAIVMDTLSAGPATRNFFAPATNYPWYHFLTPGLFFMMMRIFVPYIMDEARQKWLPYVIMAVFFSICLIVGRMGEGLLAFPSIPVGIYSLTGIVFSLLYFAKLLQTLEVKYLEREPMFWVASGFLIYFSGNLLMWFAIDFITYNYYFFNSIYRITKVLTLLLNVLFIVALVLNPQPENRPQATSPSYTV